MKPQIIRLVRSILGAITAITCLAGSAHGAIVGQWDFSSGLSASTGMDLEYFDGPGGATETGTQFGTAAGFGIPNPGGTTINVMRVPKNSSTMGYVMNPNAAGNGGGALINQYSLVMDLYFPEASSGKTRCLIQIDEPWLNSNEGEFYIGANNGLGTPENLQGVVTPSAWHRVVITVDLAASPPTAIKYLDGVKAGQETLNDVLDGRWALGTYRALLFTDSAGGFEEAYVNSIQLHDAVLSANYVAGLGAPAADAIPAAVVPIAIVQGMVPANGDGFVYPFTPIQADIMSATPPVSSATVGLSLDGVAVSPTITNPSASVLRVSYNPGLLPPESQHTVRLTFVDPALGTGVREAQWSFRMAPYHLLPPDPTKEGLLYLPFDESSATEGGVVSDRSPSGNNGILRLQPGAGDLKIAGAISNAIDFTINQSVPQNYVELSYRWVGSPNSFAAWVKVDSNYPSSSRVGVVMGNYPEANAINWEVTTSGRPRVYWGYASGSLLDWTVSDDLRTGQWEHMAFVRDPVQGRFSYYRNGKLMAVNTNAGPEVIPLQPPYVGSDRRASSFQPFRGALDELMVYERALGSNEVFRLYTVQAAFPKFLFSTPPIARLFPAESASAVSITTAIEVVVDESFSSNTVNLSSVQLSVNGGSLTPQATRSNQIVRISGVPVVPLAPLSTNTARVRYLDNASAPHETVRQWSFVTGPLPPLPVITWFSGSITAMTGDDVTLGVKVSGIPPITYQWRLGSTAIPDATNASLSLPAITPSHAGAYDVIVTGPNGAVTSQVAQVTVVSTLALSGLLQDVTAYYDFEAHVSGIVSNAARASGFAGFWQDHATLYGAEGDPSAILPPFTTVPARVRAGAGAMDCDGFGDYGDIAGNPVAIELDWSISAWFKPDTGGLGYLGSTRAFVFETGGSAYPISFGLRAGTSGNSNFQLYSDYVSGTDPYRDYQVPNSQVDQWHHITIVYRAADALIEGYLDGTLRYTIAVTGTLNPGFAGFRVGTYRAASARFFKGQIDEVALWQRSLTVSEVTNLFGIGQEGVSLESRISQPGGAALATSLVGYYPLDAHINRVVSNRATAVGGTGFYSDDLNLTGGYIDPVARIYPISNDPALARAGRGALTCDGTNDFAQVFGNPIDPNQNWSAGAWFKPDTAGLGVTGTTRLFVFEGGGATYPISFALRAGTPDPLTGDPRTDFQVYSQSTTNAVFQDYDVPNTQVDQWHQILITYNAAAGLLLGYLDGTETHRIDLGPYATLQAYNGLNIGTYRAADGRFFKGLIDEVTFWQRTLSPAAVAEAYSIGAAGQSWLASTPKSLSLFSSAQGFNLSWQGGIGSKYQIEASANLKDWILITPTEHTAATSQVTVIISPTEPPPANGYYDPGLSGATQRYYRVRWNP